MSSLTPQHSARGLAAGVGGSSIRGRVRAAHAPNNNPHGGSTSGGGNEASSLSGFGGQMRRLHFIPGVARGAGGCGMPLHWGGGGGNNSSSSVAEPAQQHFSAEAFDTAFAILDRDGDGLLSEDETRRLLAYCLAVQPRRAAAAAATRRGAAGGIGLAAAKAGAALTQPPPLLGSWDERLLAWLSRTTPSATTTTTNARPLLLLSDVVWAALGAAATVAALGCAAACAAWPLASASAAAAVLLLARPPGADDAQLWPLLAGQLGGAAVALALLALEGGVPSLAARAGAVSAVVALSMLAGCAHAPAGALVVALVGGGAGGAASAPPGAAVAGVLLQLGVLLAASAAVNGLRRVLRFGPVL